MPYFSIQDFLATVDKAGMQRSSRFRCRIPVSAIEGRVPFIAGAQAGLPLWSLYPAAAEMLTRGLICESTRTPSRSFDTTDMTLYGYEEKYPVFTTYTDLDCTFYTPLVRTSSGTSNDVLKLFNEWQNLIHPITSRNGQTDSRQEMTLNFPDQYRLREGMVLEMFDNFHPKRNAGGLGVNVNTEVPVFGNVSIGAVFGQPPANDPELPPTTVYRFFNVYPITVESSAIAWSAVGEFQKVTVSFAFSYWTSQQSSTTLA